MDSNLLVYAQYSGSPHYPATRRWLDEQFESGMRIGLPWQSLIGFLRVITSPRICKPPMPMAEAWSGVVSWLDHPSVWIPEPTGSHRTVLGRLLVRTGAASRIANDAHLAALAIEHGLVLCSADSDFARFPDLHWRNPLTGGESGVAERHVPYGAPARRRPKRR